MVIHMHMNITPIIQSLKLFVGSENDLIIIVLLSRLKIIVFLIGVQEYYH